MKGMSANVIFRLFGQNRLPTAHERQTPPTDDNGVEVTQSLHETISKLNWKDVALYHHVRRRLASRQEEWLSPASLGAE